MDAFETFSTTADVGIRIQGRGYEDLFQNALKGLNLLTLGGQPCSFGSPAIYPFEFHGDSPENLLVNLLAEVLFLLQTQNKVTLEIKCKTISETDLMVDLLIKPLESAPVLEIKAVTYHNLKIKKNGHWLSTEVVFDI